MSATIVELDKAEDRKATRSALHFVLLIGILSLFADFTYEGARSILGPFLASLGASGTAVAIISGVGELAGYGLRLVSGRAADRTRRYWPITIFGYAVQMAAVPALALVGNWPAAAALIILERVGKAIRNPPRDVMISHAGIRLGGYGWAFGLHEALDQFGALVGPLVVAMILVRHGNYHMAFAALAIPAGVNLCLVLLARLLYPRPQDLQTEAEKAGPSEVPRIFWIYLSGAGLVAAGFADYPLLAYHMSVKGSVPSEWIATLYAIAMGVSGTGSLLFGRLFDRHGFATLVWLTVVSALFAPLIFLGGFWATVLGAAVWGLGMGAHESIIPAAVAPMAASKRRATAFGIFTAGYGISWFGGSVIIGLLYAVSLSATIAFCVAAQLVAAVIFVWVGRRRKK